MDTVSDAGVVGLAECAPLSYLSGFQKRFNPTVRMPLKVMPESTGAFTSSSALLNSYQDAQADTADAHLNADSAIADFDMENFYENWMRTHRDDRNQDGTFGHTVPGTVGAKGVTGPVWSASFVLINWDLYWYFGPRTCCR
ncbi:hypothetical protein ACLVWQ_36695 [Streptomyces sp. CWNU-52B]|uniref:alpha-L-rhamnosidase-related protein n=1 Tax=unclassified Streptomyces TaxID=2593676 RepID=UPI0039BF4CAD